MKEQVKAMKIELSNEEIANLSNAEFKTLVIRMLTEMVEYGPKIEEEVTESLLRGEQAALLPLIPLPHIQCHNTAHGLPHPGVYLSLPPLTM